MTEEKLKIELERRRGTIKSLTWSVFALMICTLAASSLYMWAVDKYGEDIPYWPMMTLQGASSIITFLISALIGVGIAEKKLCGSDMSWHLSGTMTILIVILIFVVQPLINWGSFFNEMIYSWPIMEWAKQFDIDQSSTLAKMMSFTTVSHYAMTILIMAILPAICEEFFFRGVVLRGLSNAMITKTGAIVSSAVFFSMMHMDFDAFIPRFILGILLGYIYIYTHGLLYPIIAHSLNNIMVLVMISNSDMPVEQLLNQPTENPGPWLPICSLLLTVWICEAIYFHDKLTALFYKKLMEFEKMEQSIKDDNKIDEDAQDDQENVENKK